MRVLVATDDVIGEEMAGQDAARLLLSRWTASCIILMVLSLLVGYAISMAGNPVAGNLTGTAVLLIGGVGLYLRFHFKAQELVPPEAAEQASIAVASLVAVEPKGVDLAKVVLGICLTASLATFVWALVRYESMIDQPFVSIMAAPSFNLAYSPFLALIALLTATAKRSYRAGSGGRSFEAQKAFRATVTRLTTWSALLFCAFMTLLSVQIVRVGLSDIDGLGVVLFCVAGILAVTFIGYTMASLIRIIRRYGQGGALLESGTVEAPLTNGLADNAHWVWGVFFVNKNDPSIMVEKRFGIGYTFNYGNRSAILILVSFLVLCLGLTALILFKTAFGGG